MDLLYVYCFKSVGSYKHKLSRIESILILFLSFSIFILYYTNTEHIITNLQFHKMMKYNHACYFLSLFSSYTSFHYIYSHMLVKSSNRPRVF